MKKVEQQQIYSIRKNKAYGASSVLIGLMGTTLLLGGLTPTVQAEENDVKPEPKPVDASASDVTNASTVETDHLIVTSSQPTEGAIKPESTSTDAPKLNKENASTNALNPTNNTASQPKEETTTPTATKTEAKPEEAATAPKRAVSIVYKVRYVDRKSHKVVHEVTKTKTVETTEAKAKASVTEIGAELANDSQLENYYVPDGNPTTMTKEIVEGEDNVFVYEVEGFGEAETPKERTVALKYTVEYVDGKSGLVLASEEKEEKVSTTETVAKKEVTIQPSLATNEKLKDWVLSDGAPTSQKLTLSEGTVGKVTFKLQNSEGRKVRNKRKVQTPIVDGQPYLTLENQTKDYINSESMTFLGDGRNTYTIVYKIGASHLPNNDINELKMTQGAEDLGFTLDKISGTLTATLTPTRAMEGTYEVGFYVKSRPEIKVSGTIKITATKRYGFMIIKDESDGYVPTFLKAGDTTANTESIYGNYRISYDLRKWISPFYSNNRASYLGDYVENDLPKKEVTINGLRIPSTPFGYFMTQEGKTVKDADQDTTRYYTMLPIFAPMDQSIDFANNNKQGLSITKFSVLEASDGVEAKLIDLRHDQAPDKGVYRNDLAFQTVTEYDDKRLYKMWFNDNNYMKTPYYLQFTKLPKEVGNYFATIEITDNLGLTKKIRLNFTTYENSISGDRLNRGESYALTSADTLFEAKKEYVDEKNGTVTIPTSTGEQIIGKVVLNKANAYIQENEFAPGIELRPTKNGVDQNGRTIEANVVKRAGVKIPPGSYSFKVTARDGHFQEGGVRSFNFDVVDAINPIADQHWRESSVPTPIPVSMENGSKITKIRVESSGGYAVFEGNPNDSNISIYGLKRTPETQTARVYVTFTDGAGQTRTTFTDFNYVIDPNTVEGLEVSVTNSTQEISEGQSWQDMVITTTPSEGVTIKVDKSKLPIGTRVVDNIVDGVVVGKKIVGKGLYEGVYEVPILAVKGDIVKSTAVHLTVKPGKFVVSPETSEVEVFSNNIKAVTTEENGEIVKTPVPRYGLQNIPKGAKVTYSGGDYSFSQSGMEISADSTEITGTPRRSGVYTLQAVVNWRASNGVTRTATTTYKIIVTGLEPSLTISSAAQPNHPTDAYASRETRLIAPLGSPIPTITIKHGPHSDLSVGDLPAGLSYSYDQATHTGTITGTPSKIIYRGHVYGIHVGSRLEWGTRKENVSDFVEKWINIEIVPERSGLEIDPAEQRFNANQEMTPITVSGFDNRATIELDGAPEGVSYNKVTHQITGVPTSGVGDYSFNVRARMPESTGGEVATKGVTLHVLPIEPSLSANPDRVTVEATNRIPEITITKDPLSELAVPTVTIGGTGDPRPLSELGLSYDTTSRTITGTPTVVGSHTIHLSTTLSKRYTGVDGGVTKTLNIPVTVNAKSIELTINHQTQTKTVLSQIDPVTLTVPPGINLTVDTDKLPPGVTYNAESKTIEGTPSKVGTYNVAVTARPDGITGNDKTATVTIQVDKLEASIGIDGNNQNVQIGTEMTPVTVTPNPHASVFGTDPLLNAVSGNASGVAESNVVNYFLGAYGLTYNPTNHTITGTPTKTGRIAFTFIARNSTDLGGLEARKIFELNVVESLSKIPVITEVREGTSVVKGTGAAGATVTVTLPTGDEKTALVSGDGSWSVDTTSPLGKGQSISARQKEVNKTMSNDISATVVANAGLELSKEPIVDAIIEGATTITGKGENGSTINVTLPNGTVKTTTVTDGRWTVPLESPVAKGDNILVSQTQPNKATSPSVSATAVPTITKGDKGEDGAAGATGAAGQNGQNGRDGKDILSGTSDPTSETGKEGDKYVNTTTGDIFVKKNGQWEREGNLKGPKGDNGKDGAAGETGAAGQNGRDGQNGQNGRDGKDILSGTTDPATDTGKEGDKYVNTTTGDIFVKKNGQWEREGNIKGPKGDKGEDGVAGQNGRDGKDILSGTSDPTSDTGKEGDKYVNTTTGDIFVKKNGQWEREGNLKGPKGDKGDTPTITTQPGADGISTDIILTLPGKEPITVNVKNGTNGRDGLNGKSLVVKKEGNETKIYVEDPANPGQPLDATKPLATILDGLKGDKGEGGTNGVDGKSPVITMTDNGDGTHSIIIRNPDGSESTTKVKDGKDGKTATITTTENPDGSHTITVINPDGASKEIVVRDGKTPKLEVIDNGNGTHTVKVTDGDGNVTNTIIKDGKDGKSATATTTENPDGSHTVTITNPDGTTNHFIVKNGRDGVDGRTPTATVRNNNDGSHTIVITNPDGVTTETTIRDGQSPKITITDEQNGTHKITVLNGDGTTTETIIKDGKSPVTTVTDNHDGTYTIRVENGNGTVSETTVRDGKSPTAKVVNNGDGTHTVTIVNSDGTTTTTIVRDGQSPKLEVIDNHNGSHTIKVIGSDGKETSTTIFDGKSPTAKIVDNGDGTHTVIIVDSNGQQYTSIIRDGKDGKDGKSPTATVRNNNDGTHTITIINPDGSKTETIIKDGKDGKSPEVTVEDNGNGTYTITIINVNGIVYKTIIRDGKCGCNDKPGGHTPENPTTPKPENPTTSDEPTFAMPAPPVHDKPEFEGGVPGMPAVHEKSEYPGIPTNPKSGGETPENSTNTGGGTPENPANSNPGVPTSVDSTNSNPGVPTSVGSANSNPGVPTSVGSTNSKSGVPTSEGLTPSNSKKSSAVNEHSGSELPKTGTKAEYLPMLLGSSILLALYVGRRKEE